MNLYAGDDRGACEGYGICDGKGDTGRPQHYALDYEEEGAESHHGESEDGEAIGLTGAYGVYGLRHVSENHADSGTPAEYFNHSHNACN